MANTRRVTESLNLTLSVLLLQVKSAEQLSSEKKEGDEEEEEEEESRPPMDLFKAIFASSSESSSSEGESDKEEEDTPKDEGKMESQPQKLFNITSSTASSSQTAGTLIIFLIPPWRAVGLMTVTLTSFPLKQQLPLRRRRGKTSRRGRSLVRSCRLQLLTVSADHLRETV